MISPGRLIEALRTKYDDGWTCGRLLNIRPIPFDGDGIDPQTLIGLHVTGIDEARSSSNVKLSVSDNDPLFIFPRRTATAADSVIMYRKSEARLSGWPRAESPMRILGAAMAERKDDEGKPSWTFFVLRLKGIGTNIYIGCDQDTGRSDTGLCGLYLAAQEKNADLEREELLLASSG
ncbi:hypothetical protein BDR22DRAFT_183522 [Usnea florida]